MNIPISPVLNDSPDWKNVCKLKHVLFDTDAIISIIEFGAQSLFDEFKNIKATNCYIHPTYTELLATDNSTKRVLRQNLILKKDFNMLPLTKNEFDNASNAQTWLALKKCYPSPTDLYLAGRLASFQHDKILLLTGNISDFPYPLFERKAIIILQNEKQMKILSFLNINHEELNASLL